jgi:hypothetical protein
MIAFTILVMPDIIAISDISTTTQRRRRSGGCIPKPSDVFLVDTCPHEYLKHLLLHLLAHVIECASGEAEEALS